MLEKKENLFNTEKCMATQEKYNNNNNNNNNKILLLQCKKTINEKFYFLVKIGSGKVNLKI